MRKSRFTEAQILGLIKEQEAVMPTAEVCRKHGLNQGTFYKFKSKYGGMEISDAAKLKALEDENAKPTSIAGDNGSEFTSRAILKWAPEMGERQRCRLALHQSGQTPAECLHQVL